jgi:glutamate--cysteine ligase
MILENRDALVAWLEKGCKHKANWRIGTEHEKFGFMMKDCSPLPYGGDTGIRAILEELWGRFGWQPIFEGDNIIGLRQPDLDPGGTVTLEPGGQLELSGAPLENIHQTCAEVNRHLERVKAAGDELGVGFLGLGFSPKWSLGETPKMPKGRYKIMREYMPKMGGSGLDMMYRSATVQVNLDFSSEADMVKKFRVSLALQPIASAIFANSPFTEGRPNGYLSYRSAVWLDTDPDRTGMLAFVFEDGFGFERYVDYALDVPMYFVNRDGKYIDASGLSFKDFLTGNLSVWPGEKPTEADWVDHLTTLFPEVRLKRFLEMRGADGGPWRRLCALPALWTGLLYDQSALDAAWDLVKSWSAEERQQLREDVPRQALKTPFRNTTVLEIAREMAKISRSGLKARERLSDAGNDETLFLDTIDETIARGRCPADDLLERYHGDWQRSIDHIFKEQAY